MLGIHSVAVPRWQRWTWALATGVAGMILYWASDHRWDGPNHWAGYLLLAVIGAVVGYYGCSWERDE